jgi:hypothetical protein
MGSAKRDFCFRRIGLRKQQNELVAANPVHARAGQRLLEISDGLLSAARAATASTSVVFPMPASPIT